MFERPEPTLEPRIVQAAAELPAGGDQHRHAAKAVARRKRAMTEEQRRAVAERMRKYWASRQAAKAEDDKAQK